MTQGKALRPLHRSVLKILESAVYDMVESGHVDRAVPLLRKWIVTALDKAASHASGIVEAQTLRNASILFSGRDLYMDPKGVTATRHALEIAETEIRNAVAGTGAHGPFRFWCDYSDPIKPLVVLELGGEMTEAKSIAEAVKLIRAREKARVKPWEDPIPIRRDLSKNPDGE